MEQTKLDKLFTVGDQKWYLRLPSENDTGVFRPEDEMITRRRLTFVHSSRYCEILTLEGQVVATLYKGPPNSQVWMLYYDREKQDCGFELEPAIAKVCKMYVLGKFGKKPKELWLSKPACFFWGAATLAAISKYFPNLL